MKLNSRYFSDFNRDELKTSKFNDMNHLNEILRGSTRENVELGFKNYDIEP